MLYRSVFWVEILVAAVTGDPNEVDALVAHVIHEAVVILQRAVLLGVHCCHWVDGRGARVRVVGIQDVQMLAIRLVVVWRVQPLVESLLVQIH